MQNQQPKWPLFSKAETFVIAFIVIMVVSMAISANLQSSSTLSSVFDSNKSYVGLSCNELVEKMDKGDTSALDEYETRCLEH